MLEMAGTRGVKDTKCGSHNELVIYSTGHSIEQNSTAVGED
jgi:hypothetical protein